MLDEDLDDSHMGEEAIPLTHDTTVVLDETKSAKKGKKKRKVNHFPQPSSYRYDNGGFLLLLPRHFV